MLSADLANVSPAGTVEATTWDVTILLSTHNGQRFLREQLDSFVAQTGVRWKLIWRDDGSTDGTVAAMEAFAASQPPGKVAQAASSGTNLGIFRSFMSLLPEAADAPTVAFADQDDVWLPDKLQRAMTALRAIDPARPALYCARQTLVDEELRPLGLSPSYRSVAFPAAALQNIATGCTIVMNQAAATAVWQSEKPQRSLHDWWSCLYVAAIGGEIRFDDRPAILYRQHGANTVGAQPSRVVRLKRAIARGAAAYNRQLSDHMQALLRNSRHLSPEVVRVLNRIRDGVQGSWPRRLALFGIPGFNRQTRMETALLAVWLLRGLPTSRSAPSDPPASDSSA